MRHTRFFLNISPPVIFSRRPHLNVLFSWLFFLQRSYMSTSLSVPYSTGEIFPPRSGSFYSLSSLSGRPLEKRGHLFRKRTLEGRKKPSRKVCTSTRNVSSDRVFSLVFSVKRSWNRMEKRKRKGSVSPLSNFRHEKSSLKISAMMPQVEILFEWYPWLDFLYFVAVESDYILQIKVNSVPYSNRNI